MDILKNIILNFNFFQKINNIDILLIAFFIKIFLFLIMKNKISKIFFFYYFKFINKNINKNSKKIFFFFSTIMFLIVLFYNLIDLFPINFFKKINFYCKKLDYVPTSNINITFNLSFISTIVIIYLTIKKIGVISFLKNFFVLPIKSKYLYFLNFIIEFISFTMKPISLSLRLFGNIFSSEIIFNLISNMNFLSVIFLKFIWGIFHYIILPLQSFIFITLIIIYFSQYLKH